jgi:hypothetical protein
LLDESLAGATLILAAKSFYLDAEFDDLTLQRQILQNPLIGTVQARGKL